MPGSGEWSNGEELGQTWESRNAFSYGASKTGEKGVKRTDLLRGLLNTTDRIIQEVYNSHAHLGFIYTRITIHTYVHYIYILLHKVDCVEYGLTDIQEYYANTGAIKKAAENNRSGRKVSVSVVHIHIPLHIFKFTMVCMCSHFFVFALS